MIVAGNIPSVAVSLSEITPNNAENPTKKYAFKGSLKSFTLLILL